MHVHVLCLLYYILCYICVVYIVNEFMSLVWGVRKMTCIQTTDQHSAEGSLLQAVVAETLCKKCGIVGEDKQITIIHVGCWVSDMRMSSAIII